MVFWDQINEALIRERTQILNLIQNLSFTMFSIFYFAYLKFEFLWYETEQRGYYLFIHSSKSPSLD